MLYGIIDIGSNSVRLMLSDGGANVTKYVDTTQLSEGLALTGRLSAAAMERTLNAITDLIRRAREAGAGYVCAFATEAVRSAFNGGEFAEAVREKTGIPVEVLTGDREAEAGFLGAYTGGRIAVFDIGGASTEIVVGDELGIKYAKSVPVGVVRLKDAFGEDQAKVGTYADSMLSRFGTLPPFDKVIGIGGTPSTIVAIKLGLEPYDPKIVHGHVLTVRDIEAVYERVAALTPEERYKLKGFPPKKANVVPVGALLILRTLKYLSADSLTVSEADNQEGYLKVLTAKNRA